jgi:predicted RNA-binding Zn ribbon-like protein
MTSASFIPAGKLSVSFANLRAVPELSPEPALTWDELIGFLEQAQIVSPERGERLLQLTQTDPRSAEELLGNAARLRWSLRRIFGAMIRKERVELEWVKTVNVSLQITEGHDELAPDGQGWKIQFIARNDGLEWLLAAIARSAAELVAEGPSTRLRRCANPCCGIFFYDTSRTHMRRWCSMALCGNRSKVAAFAKRHQLRRRDS